MASPHPRPVPKEVLDRVERLLAAPMPDSALDHILRDMAFYAGARGRYCEWCGTHYHAVEVTQRTCSRRCINGLSSTERIERVNFDRRKPRRTQ